ncbi:MAG: hypothetical protein WAU91_09255 [Desulfatitalea sp.]
MKIKSVKLLLVLVLGVMIAAPLSWAKETAYNYIVAYSYKDKVVYHSPIFTQQVNGESYNEEEYAGDTASILKMEAAFLKHLEQGLKVNGTNFTVSARVAYKSDSIAKNRMDKELTDFRFKGLDIKEAKAFRY